MQGAVFPKKQDKKKRGGVNLRVDTDTAYDAYGPPPNDPSSHVERAVIHFDRDVAFAAGKLPQCTKPQINTLTTEAAKATCGGAVVGQGTATLNGAFGPASAIVTAFNGAFQNGAQVILLHARAGAPLNTTTVLTGVLGPSTRGGPFGRQLDVQIDPLAGGFEVITHFDTTVNKRVVKKKVKKFKKKGKKRKKVFKKFYASARCGKGKTWSYFGDFTFVNNSAPGSFVLSDGSKQFCKQKPNKKKRKNRKKRNR